MGVVTGEGDYPVNTAITIEAIPNAGYRFVQWNDGNRNNSRMIIVTQDVNFTAIFTIDAPGMFYLSVTVNNPSMGSLSGGGDYAENTAVTIEAMPNAGYCFVQWNDGNTNNPRTITVTQDTNFTAEFRAIITYHVTVIANNTSMGTATGSGDYAENTTATITATANQGYRFVRWNDGNTNNPRTITVTQDINFIAEFRAIIRYYVTVTANNPSMGTVTGSGDYAENTTATITATANQGYRFVQWNDGNTQNPRTITVTQDISFTAIFVQATSIKEISTTVINIYPNPATDNIHITLSENVHQAVFTLYDMQGKILIRKEINSDDAVSVSNLAAGIYIYYVRTEKENKQGKIMIND
jgi:5-enolpyruvylshikimate-3-phosphate synthase